MTTPRVSRIGDYLYQIDAMLFGEPDRLSCYLYDTPERVLVETGPSVTLPHLLDGLTELGVDDVATILVTHIHLDHAGGAGLMAQRFPDARVGVHAEGARHMVSPERLLASATRIYGEDGMRTKWGPMTPIAEDRLLVLDEGSKIPLGAGRSLDVMYTPGHAKHHVVFHDPDGGGMYVGDSVGIVFPHGHIVQPNTPPPDFDASLVIHQLHRMAEREPAFLGFAHFGTRPNVAETLQQAETRLDAWVRFVAELAAEPDTAADKLRTWVLDGYRAEGVSEDLIRRFDDSAFWWMHPTGILRWLEQQGRI